MKKVYVAPEVIIAEIMSEVSFLAAVSEPDEGREVTGGGPTGTIDITNGGDDDDDDEDGTA